MMLASTTTRKTTATTNTSDKRAADAHSHEQCEHQMHRGTHAHALDHLERILHVGHIGGHTGDKAAVENLSMLEKE